MHIVLAGGTGFVGKILQEQLLQHGYRVTILTRSARKVSQSSHLQAMKWLSDQTPNLDKVDAFINLAGESINGLRWTKKKKQKILSSRINTTQKIMKIMNMLPNKPNVLINASAIGYYGMSETELFTESSISLGDDFLANVVKVWEREASEAEKLGVRTVFARFGVILGDGGAFPFMSLPYKLGIGGTVGSGKQWISWVHVEDVARMILFAIQHEEICGPLNVTALNPVSMKLFGKTISKVLQRPHWLPVPSIAMKLLLGEMSELLLGGQRVIPVKALENDFTFQYPELEEALVQILHKRERASNEKNH